MITIKHARAVFTVQPENAETTRELLALIDKSKGRKGRKFKAETVGRYNQKVDSRRRSYPSFYAGMSTADYISAYVSLNQYLFVGAYLEDKLLTYTHADRPAPMLDPSIPEVEQL